MKQELSHSNNFRKILFQTLYKNTGFKNSPQKKHVKTCSDSMDLRGVNMLVGDKAGKEAKEAAQEGQNFDLCKFKISPFKNDR